MLEKQEGNGLSTKPGLVGGGRSRMTAGQRKAQIIDVTLRLVDKHGVQGTTTARIAAAAGVTEPTLYKYFENRREMLMAALDVVFDQAVDVIRSSQEPNVVERLRKIGQHHTELTFSKSSGFVNPLFEFVVAPAELGLRSRVRARNVAIAEALASMVKEGIAQGSIRADVDPQLTAWRVLGFYWFEDVSFLMDLDEVVTLGVSTDLLERVLADIAVEPGAEASDVVSEGERRG